MDERDQVLHHSRDAVSPVERGSQVVERVVRLDPQGPKVSRKLERIAKREQRVIEADPFHRSVRQLSAEGIPRPLVVVEEDELMAATGDDLRRQREHDASDPVDTRSAEPTNVERDLHQAPRAVRDLR